MTIQIFKFLWGKLADCTTVALASVNLGTKFKYPDMAVYTAVLGVHVLCTRGCASRRFIMMNPTRPPRFASFLADISTVMAG
jgi:hypothetical protein